MPGKEYPCNCGSCKRNLRIVYYGRIVLDSDTFDPTCQRDLSRANDLYIFIESLEGKTFGNTTHSMEEIPKIIEDLQKLYQEYLEVQGELKKQGKLESLSENNKANLSSEEIERLNKNSENILKAHKKQ